MAVTQNAAPPRGPVTGRSPSLAGARTSLARLLADRLFRYAVVAGGLAIIVSILGILVFICWEAGPLASGARVTPAPPVDVSGLPAGSIVGDEYGEKVVHLDRDGLVRVIDASSGALLEQRAWPGLSAADESAADGALELSGIRVVPGTTTFAAATETGRLVSLEVGFRVTFDDRQQRQIEVRLEPPAVVAVDDSPVAVREFTLRIDGEELRTAAAWLDDGRLVVVRRAVKRNALTMEASETFARAERTLSSRVRRLLLTGSQEMLVGSLDDGRLMQWPLEADLSGEPSFSDEMGAPAAALTFLIGDRALVAGREDGALEIWFLLRGDSGAYALERIREFPGHAAAIRHLSPSMRDKGFVALDAGGEAGLYYSTSVRTLWRGDAPIADAASMFFSPRANAVLFSAPGRVASVEVDNPHPEVSLRALFGKVWYESYPEPEYVWQSSSASDDFEPKLSLTPLVVGTLKGTIYSLLLAIPIGVFGAMYASEFMHPALKRYVKPTIEIMAALPSVVLGFLAGLWLAPRLERLFPSLVLMLIVLPLAVIAVGHAWRRVPGRIRNRVPSGSEVLLYAFAISAVAYLCVTVSPSFELIAFDGSFPQWLFDTTGMRYDQRNAVVIGLAMGFAVIPIIFSVAEDAFSNVPRTLVSGSLALGATRWQTVTRVVLPTASPGIFSAIMIGFGRAVGETMIVLMATGNTPIMDWSPFNGFRTLSANIAVEIPEAPQGETLYRTLFLAALLLFLLTFVINTLAEVIRHRLRRRYANL